jgi:hypothetical protein
MAATPHDSSGTTLQVGATKFTVTGVNVSFSSLDEANRIDISHLGLSTGNKILTMKAPLVGDASGDTGKEVSFDYIGTSQLAGGFTGTYSIAGGVTLSGNCTVVSSSLVLAVNDVIRGSATLRIE